MMSRVALLTFAVAGAHAACAPDLYMTEPGQAETKLTPQAMADKPHLVNGNHGDVVAHLPSHIGHPSNFYYPVVSQSAHPDKIPAGTSFRFHCPRNDKMGDECHTYVCVYYMFVYHCPPCDVKTGGWADLLQGGEGSRWEYTSCGPKFTHGSDAFLHPTVVYKTVVSPWEPVVITTPASTDVTDFMGFYAGSIHDNDVEGCPQAPRPPGPYPTLLCGRNCPEY